MQIEGNQVRRIQAKSVHTVVATGPVPEVAALLEKKPTARIAIVQGSFDWVHNGHLDLVDAVVGARTQPKKGGANTPFDLVVVVPTAVYERKPFLAASYERRIDLVTEAC